MVRSIVSRATYAQMRSAPQTGTTRPGVFSRCEQFVNNFRPTSGAHLYVEKTRSATFAQAGELRIGLVMSIRSAAGVYLAR